MRLVDAAICTACVVLSAVGQVMLRAAALAATQSRTAGPWSWFSGAALAAVAVYLSAMLLWFWVLGRVPLTQAFAFFGLSFMLVPLLAHVWLRDPVSPFTWAGGVIIMAGIAVTNWPR